MFRRTLRNTVFGAAALGLASVTAYAAEGDAAMMIQEWPDVSQQAAQAMMEKYGQPDEATETMLVWHDSAPWKRTIVYKETVDHDFPMPHQDVLEQSIPYDVPVDMFDDLAAYDGSVIVERTKGEISARCDKEGANFLAINLADKIVKGEMSVEEARQAYGEAIKQAVAGNPPEIMQSFAFDVLRNYAGDADETIIQVAEQPGAEQPPTEQAD